MDKQSKYHLGIRTANNIKKFDYMKFEMYTKLSFGS